MTNFEKRGEIMNFLEDLFDLISEHPWISLFTVYFFVRIVEAIFQ
jgi:hypothetical protein